MARDVQLKCDICQKPTEAIAHKLFLAPAGRISPSRAPHSEYTHHLDVGVCCAKAIMALKWTKRMSAEDYHRQRRNGSKKISSATTTKKGRK